MAINPEIAFYYPGPVWYHAEAMKNLLLFFDGIGLLVPEYMVDRPEIVDPSLAVPLRDQGLLHILTPESLVDSEASAMLAAKMADIIHSGFLDTIGSDGSAFQELSMSRLGYGGDQSLAKMIFEELKARGLAHDSVDGVSIPMHHQVRNLVLVLLAQILRTKGSGLGLDLSPATDRPQIVHALTALLNQPDAPSTGNVIASDMTAVGVDLSLVPLDEVLSFRADHLRQHRTYANSVRAFVRDLSQMTAAERATVSDDRNKELNDLGEDLRRLHRKSWNKPASFAFSAAGALWRITRGDPLGAVLAAGALLAGYDKKSKEFGGAFSFVFAARDQWHY
jgi:hypothetical protein